MSSSWVFFGMVIAAVPQCVNKDTGEREHAAIEITRNGHQLSYKPGVISIKAPMPLLKDLMPQVKGQQDSVPIFTLQPLQFEHRARPLQYITAGQRFKAFFSLFEYIAQHEAGWIGMAVDMSIGKKRKAG